MDFTPGGSLILAGEGNEAFDGPPLDGTVWIAETSPVGSGPGSPKTGPRLGFRVESGRLRLTWPESDQGPYLLQSTDDVNGPFAMEEGGDRPDRNTVEIEIPNSGRRFFRLTQ